MSFIKWAGGKQQLLPQLIDLFPNLKDIKGYCEPFLGGGSVFFYLENMGYLQNVPIQLSDINSGLITTYRMVRENLPELIKELDKYQHNHTKEEFYKIRNNFHKQTNSLTIASQFIYLNKTGFNGLWRVNSQGINNQSIGHEEKVQLYNNVTIQKCSKALKNARIRNLSFEEAIQLCIKDTFTYLDPPYDNIGEENNSSFVGYTSDSFKLKRPYLLDTFRKLDEIGCKVMMSNSSTSWIMSQFKDYHIIVVKANRICAGKAEDRNPVDEVVITNYKPVKKQFSLMEF